MSWPKQFEGGKTIDEIGIGMDIFPTILTAAGGDPSQYTLDGTDILPMVVNETPSPHSDLFWTRGNKGETRVIQRDRWKLHLDGEDIHLCNLNTDRGETTNVAQEHPDRTKDMLDTLNTWHQSVTQ